MDNMISRTGALFCFCEDEMKNNDATDKFTDYTFIYTKWDGTQGGSVTAPICKHYYRWMTGGGYILEQCFNYLIVAASFVIRQIILMIVNKVGFISLTKETGFAMLCVFWITFINYGIIYLLASWDNRTDRDSWWDKFFEGLYPDFNSLWYNDVGVLVVAIDGLVQ